MPDIFLPFTLLESVVLVVPFSFSVCLIFSDTSFARWAPTAHKTTVISISATSQWISACERCTNQYTFFKFQADFHLHKLVRPTRWSLQKQQYCSFAVKLSFKGVNNFESVKCFVYHIYNKDSTQLHFDYKLSDETVVCAWANCGNII